MSGSITTIDTSTLGPASDFQSGRQRSAGGNAHQHALFLRQAKRRIARDHLVHLHDLIDHIGIEYLRDEVRRPALNSVGIPLPSRQQGCLRRFGGDDAGFRPRPFYYLSRAGEGAAGTPAGDPIVQTLSGKILQNLRAGR